jgi:hypothetical protein
MDSSFSREHRREKCVYGSSTGDDRVGVETQPWSQHEPALVGARMRDDEIAIFDQVAEHDEVQIESSVPPALGASPPMVVFD